MDRIRKLQKTWPHASMLEAIQTYRGDINQRYGRDVCTILHAVLQRGWADCVYALAARGDVDPSIPNLYGELPLCAAARHSMTMLRTFMNAFPGLDLNARSGWSTQTALHMLASKDVKLVRASDVEWFLGMGADPAPNDFWRQTPADIARLSDRTDIEVVLRDAVAWSALTLRRAWMSASIAGSQS